MENRVQKVIKNKLVRVVAGGATIVGGLQGAHAISSDIPDVPAIYKSADQEFHAVLAFKNSLSPSKGEVFHSRATSGEITKQNTVQNSLAEALKLANEKTSATGKLYFIVPNANGSSLEYQRNGEQTGIKGIENETTIISPYKGHLRWEQYENNGIKVVTITVDNVGSGHSTEHMSLMVTDADLLFPPRGI